MYNIVKKTILLIQHRLKPPNEFFRFTTYICGIPSRPLKKLSCRSLPQISVMNRELNLEESSFIASEFTKYRDARNQLMLNNPYEYYSNLEKLSEIDVCAVLKDGDAKM